MSPAVVVARAPLPYGNPGHAEAIWGGPKDFLFVAVALPEAEAFEASQRSKLVLPYHYHQTLLKIVNVKQTNQDLKQTTNVKMSEQMMMCFLSRALRHQSLSSAS